MLADVHIRCMCTHLVSARTYIGVILRIGMKWMSFVFVADNHHSVQTSAKKYEHVMYS